MLSGALFAIISTGKTKTAAKVKLRPLVQNAPMTGGGIILITAAGGIWRHALQETGISERIAGLTKEFQMALIPLAF